MFVGGICFCDRQKHSNVEEEMKCLGFFRSNVIIFIIYF